VKIGHHIRRDDVRKVIELEGLLFYGSIVSDRLQRGDDISAKL